MKLSAAARYAVQALVFIARAGDDRPVTCQRISRGCHLSEGYLQKVLSSLERARILRSLKGRLGGFRLARPVRELTLLDVLEATDGPVHADASAALVGQGRATARRLAAAFDQAAERLREELRRVRLAELVAIG